MSILLILSLALAVVNSLALLVQISGHKRDAVACDWALRTLRSDNRSELKTVESNLRKEIEAARLESSQSRMTEYTLALSGAISQALNENTLVTRQASTLELRAGRPRP